MTPPNTPVDLQDLAIRIAEAVAEAALKSVSAPSKTPTPSSLDAKKQKAKEELERLRALHLVTIHHARILKTLEDYKQKMASDPAPVEAISEPGFFESERFRNGLEMGMFAFLPYLYPLGKAMEVIPKIQPFGLNLSWESIKTGWQDFSKQAEESKKAFDASIEGAIWNPTSLEELEKGTLFVIQEDALNEIVSSVLAKGSTADKVRNVHITIDGDRLKIKGEYKTKLCWVDFTAQLEFEQKNGETSGSLKKIEAVGFDLGDLFKTDILNAFGKFGFAAPENAELRDLSWIQIPGIKRLEIRRDKVIIEREPVSDGPS